MKTISLILVTLVVLLQSGCEHVPLTPEKIVVFSVPQGFRGPIVFRIDPASEGLPIIRGHEFTYTVPPSGIVAVHSMDASNGALWKNYSVRYPDGSAVRSYGYGDAIEESRDYLFVLGEQSFGGKTRVLFLVSTVGERQKLQARPTRDIEEASDIWKKLPEAPDQSPEPTRSARGSS
ncbi:MAG TPA: hypothetical protein PLB90_12015 [Opitutaceae bacterium]|nr:hypothetical protein [Opitutaceae bacterium]